MMTPFLRVIRAEFNRDTFTTQLTPSGLALHGVFYE